MAELTSDPVPGGLPIAGSPRKRVFCLHEPGFTRLLKLFLERSGKYVVCEENQDEKPSHRMQVARDFRPDIIVTNIVMPHADGGDMAALFRADPLLRNTPLVFLSKFFVPSQNGVPFNRREIVICDIQPASTDDLMRTLDSHFWMEP
jgi:CheY-like chemotaxis protein